MGINMESRGNNMETLNAKSAIRITDIKDYDQSKSLTFILCALKAEARKIHQVVKNECLLIGSSDKRKDPLDLYDIIEFRYDTN